MARYPDDLGRKATRHDREYFSYTECDGKVARRTKICQDKGESIRVEIEETGLSLNQYSEPNSVAGLSTATVLNYIVPVQKELKLKTIECSGENRALYIVEINNVVQSKKSTYFTKYNTTFEFFDFKLNAGDNLKITVQNKSTTFADFNANILGVLQDA